MKRILVGLLAAILMTAGLVGVSSSPATAACPYTRCLATGTTLDGPSNARSNEVVRFKARVRTLGSTVVPRGTQRFILWRVTPSGKKIIRDTTRRVDADGRYTYNLGKLQPSTYRLQLRYRPAPDSRWKQSRSRLRTLNVKAPR